jgi:hypothetical protein
LACPITQSATAYRSWNVLANTTLTRTWWPLNAGTTWGLSITGATDKTQKFSLTNEWCLSQSGFAGYVAAHVDIPLN